MVHIHYMLMVKLILLLIHINNVIKTPSYFFKSKKKGLILLI